MPTRTTRSTASRRTSTTSATDRLRAYCKKQGFSAVGGKRAVMIQSYYALREMLGQQLQSQASVAKGQNKGLNWRAWNDGGFDKIIGGNPTTAPNSKLDEIAANMTEVAHKFLAPHFSSDVTECLKQLSALNQKSIQDRNASRRNASALAEAVAGAVSAGAGADEFPEDEEFDDDDADADDDVFESGTSDSDDDDIEEAEEAEAEDDDDDDSDDLDD